MNSDLNLMPLNFREFGSTNKLLITNSSGAFAFLESREQLEQMLQRNWAEIPAKKIDELAAKNFVSENGDQLVRANLLASGLATNIASSLSGPSLFMVVPTLRCDHNCGYCQVSRVPVTKSGYDLQVDTINKILGVIKHTSHKTVKIEFQGGEPLLAFEYVKEFVRLAKQKLQDKSLSFVICSALGPLNDKIIEWARDENVVFSVSLDGPAKVHNINRPSKYFDPLANTMKGIALIQSELGVDRVSCLATVTRETMNYPKELVRTYFDINLESIFIRPLSPFGFAAPFNTRIAYSAEEYFEFYKACLENVIELNCQRTFVEETAYVHMSRIFRPGFTSYVDLQSPAGYVLGAMIFNYDGNIFGSDEARMLWESTKAPELVLGSINDSFETVFQNEITTRLLSDTFLCAAPGCDECAYQPYCGADPLHHLATQGDHLGNKSVSFFCKLQRLMFDHLLELIDTNPDATKVLSSWLER